MTEEDFLLPGGEWDPSISTASNRSKRSIKLRKSKNRSNSDGASDVGSYDPPPFVPSCRKLPTFEEFRLLKTVGKGSFGKVCRHAHLPIIRIDQQRIQLICVCLLSLPSHQVLMCVHNPTRILYAIKVVPKSKITTQKQVNQILAECRILQ